MLTEAAKILQEFFYYLRLLAEWFSEMNQYVNANFGVFVQLALDLLILYIVFFVVYQIIRLSFRILFRIVVPSVILTGIVFLLTSCSFFNILPIFVCLLLAINLVRP
jgi:hypothetical protein